ncbi:MAG: NUDIX hydrolase [Thermodesulfobacteriota bacterium]|nr:NUDIX hydrolase [Thermodesulfobacteriota bacterium]
MDIMEMKKETDFKHLNLFSMKYRDRLGNKKAWIFASRSKEPVVAKGGDFVSVPDAVVLVPWHREKNRLVIIREFRVPLGGYQYGFPAGLVDEKESVEQAGKRELKEETGLDLVKVLKKSPPVYSSSGMTDESVSLLYVECSGEPSLEFNEDSEDIEVMMFSKDDASNLLKTPDIKFDVKSWIVLSTFAELGKF